VIRPNTALSGWTMIRSRRTACTRSQGISSGRPPQPSRWARVRIPRRPIQPCEPTRMAFTRWCRRPSRSSTTWPSFCPSESMTDIPMRSEIQTSPRRGRSLEAATARPAASGLALRNPLPGMKRRTPAAQASPSWTSYAAAFSRSRRVAPNSTTSPIDSPRSKRDLNSRGAARPPSNRCRTFGDGSGRVDARSARPPAG
jgi:hypothetical protein